MSLVGSGSAGAVVASRLSEDPDVTLEAGKAECPEAAVPLQVGDLQTTEYDWKYKTEPSKTFCKGLKNRVIFRYLFLKIM